VTPPGENAFPWPPSSYPGKRAFDLLVASVGLLLASPLLLVLALAVRVTSRGPILYRGRRAGLAGKEFDQLKFRTMRLDPTRAGTGTAFTGKDDPRVTRGGRVLRLFKLDELPQLVNVLRGEMSIVGPRPEDAALVARCYTPEQLRVLSVRPGLTCLLQVRIYPDFTSTVPEGADPQEHYESEILPRRIEEDLEYVDRMSLWLDLRICLQTLYCVLVKSWFVLWRQRKDVSSGGLERA